MVPRCLALNQVLEIPNVWEWRSSRSRESGRRPLQGSGGPFPARLAIVRSRDDERADEQTTHLENAEAGLACLGFWRIGNGGSLGGALASASQGATTWLRVQPKGAPASGF